jgi:hypothetical protein
MIYNFFEFMELGIAYEGLKRGAAPRHLQLLAENKERIKYKRAYAAAATELLTDDPKAFDGDPDERPMFAHDFYVRLRDRFSRHPGKIELATQLDGKHDVRAGELVEIIDGEEIVIVQMKVLMQRLMRLANVAPVIRAGRKS